MDLTLAQVAAGWPLAASLAAIAARGFHAGRRRSALNECLHELRRPLQTLALAGPGQVEGSRASLRMAARALERLDREINGGPEPLRRAQLPAEGLARATVERSRRWAEASGASLGLRLGATGATVLADADRLGQALDNLVANAIEHGGPSITVETRREAGRLAFVVIDSGAAEGGRARLRWEGRTARRQWRQERRSAALPVLGGRRRHGHGLPVVRRVAAEHGGELRLQLRPDRTEAILLLPPAGESGAPS